MCWGHQKNCCGNSIFHGLRQMINNSNSIMARSKRKRKKKGKPIACVLRKKINYISSTVWTSVRFHDNHLSNIFIFPFFSPPTPCLVAHRHHSVFHSFHFSLAFNVTKNPWKSVETTILSGSTLDAVVCRRNVSLSFARSVHNATTLGVHGFSRELPTSCSSALQCRTFSLNKREKIPPFGSRHTSSDKLAGWVNFHWYKRPFFYKETQPQNYNTDTQK